MSGASVGQRACRTFVAAAALAVLFSPAAEAADTTIGSNLAGDATSNLCFGLCTYIQTSGGAPVAASPVDGTVVRWRLKAASTGGTVTLRVLRPAGANFTAVASSVTQTVTSDMNIVRHEPSDQGGRCARPRQRQQRPVLHQCSLHRIAAA